MDYSTWALFTFTQAGFWFFLLYFTGAVWDQTINLTINRWPAPELQPLKNTIKTTFGTPPAFMPPPLSWQNDGCWIISVLLQWHEDSVHPSVPPSVHPSINPSIHLDGLAEVVVQRISGPISSWSSSSSGGDTSSHSRDDPLCVSWVWTTNTACSNVYVSLIWQKVRMIAGGFLCCSNNTKTQSVHLSIHLSADITLGKTYILYQSLGSRHINEWVKSSTYVLL